MATQRGLPAVRGALDNTEPYQSTTAVVDDHGKVLGVLTGLFFGAVFALAGVTVAAGR